MMAWVHASIGAFVGGRCSSKRAAFVAGAVSHGVADLVPHRDYDMPIEVPLAATALLVIANRFGTDSPEFAGAVGGISPDIENGLNRFGLVKDMVYPTHTDHWWFVGHGRKVDSPLPQIILAACCIAMAHKLSKTPR
jgi:hypothetical protein